MDILDEKQFPKTSDNLIKDETFDEFLLRAYSQLTPEEQVQVRRKY